MSLFHRILAIHMRGAEPMRYKWLKRPGFLARLWRWLRDDSDWDGRQW